MYANFASGSLIVLGAVFAILGLILAGNMVVVVIGLASILAGGLLSLASRERVGSGQLIQDGVKPFHAVIGIAGGLGGLDVEFGHC